jgi:iron complex outermembrane recepter protein
LRPNPLNISLPLRTESLVVILALLWSIPCGAQDTAPSLPRVSVQTEQHLQEELVFLREETVVTANWREQPISEAPSNVYVISAEDIRQSGATDLPTLLRRVPGLSVIEMSGGDFNVSMRGNNQQRANRILLLIDGRSSYVDAQGLVPWKTLPVSFLEIKQIEVLKGPASVIYGFNAFDGVINIITKAPQDMKGTTLQAGAGEYGTVRTAAVHGGQAGDFGYRLSIGHDQQQQWRERSSLAFRADRINGQMNYRLNDGGAVQFESGVIDSNRDDFPSADFVRSNAPYTLGFARASYERDNFFVRAFWSQNNLTSNYETIPALAPFIVFSDKNGHASGIPFLTNTYDLVSQYSHAIGSAHRITLGANYRHNTLSGTQISGFSQEDRFGIYLQDEWRLLPTVTLTAGIRMDTHTEIDPTYSPRVALIYSPHPHHTLRLSGSVAYRPPTLFETNADLRTTTTIFGFSTTNVGQGSHHLKPERITSYEAEYQGWFFDHRARMRLTLFDNHIADVIETSNLSPTSGTWINVPGVADIQGAEAGLEFLPASWLKGYANYSYQSISQSLTGAARRGGPRSTVNGGLRANWDSGVNADVALHYVGGASYPIRTDGYTPLTTLGLLPVSAIPSERVKSYTLLNLRGGYRFWNQRAEVAISAYNALNDRHREHPLGDTIGSRVMGWLTLTL